MDSSARSNGRESQNAPDGSVQAVSATSAPSSNGTGDVVVNIPDSVPSNPSRRIVTNEIEANCLEYIETVPRLRLILADWESKYKESRQRIDRKESLSLNVKNEIYHLIGFFSVFQGVVLTTVSQASSLNCHNWWGPFALSLLCSIATLFGVCHKFYNFFEWKRATVEEIQHSKVLKSQIHLLKKLGKKFDFSLHAPDQDDQKEKERKKKNVSWGSLIFNRYFILAFLVILSMLGFSAIILISCFRILCDSGDISPTSSPTAS